MEKTRSGISLLLNGILPKKLVAIYPFTFDATGLGGHDVVVFEKLYVKIAAE